MLAPDRSYLQGVAGAGAGPFISSGRGRCWRRPYLLQEVDNVLVAPAGLSQLLDVIKDNAGRIDCQQLGVFEHGCLFGSELGQAPVIAELRGKFLVLGFVTQKLCVGQRSILAMIGR